METIDVQKKWLESHVKAREAIERGIRLGHNRVGQVISNLVYAAKNDPNLTIETSHHNPTTGEGGTIKSRKHALAVRNILYGRN